MEFYKFLLTDMLCCLIIIFDNMFANLRIKSLSVFANLTINKVYTPLSVYSSMFSFSKLYTKNHEWVEYN